MDTITVSPDGALAKHIRSMIKTEGWFCLEKEIAERINRLQQNSINELDHAKDLMIKGEIKGLQWIINSVENIATETAE